MRAYVGIDGVTTTVLLPNVGPVILTVAVGVSVVHNLIWMIFTLLWRSSQCAHLTSPLC